jgi:alpha-beta hydrolase superfamily lysophospholipase
VLRARLRALIELAGRRHRGPLRVVAHSLGSIIALSALDDWQGPGAVVELTTIGSPLMLLARRLPCEYGAARLDRGHRRMPAVVRWRNYYFDQDLIGRRLDPEAALSQVGPKLASSG